MPHVVMNWLTALDITSANFGEQFFGSMEAYLPQHLPSVCGVTEPLTIAFSEMTRVLELWKKHLLWRGTGVQGDVHHGKFWHSCVRHDYEAPFNANDDPIGMLRNASTLLGIDYSCCHVFESQPLLPEDDMLQGLVSKDLQSYLPTIPWCCCFGSVYIDLIGRERITAAPFWRVEELSGGYLLCQAAEHASDCLGEQFQSRRERIKDALGRQYFYAPVQPGMNAVTPTFRFLHSRNGAAEEMGRIDGSAL